jgi:MFS family permease
VVSIALVLKIMGQDSLYGELSDEQESACSSSLIAGMVFGQLLFGWLGDRIGVDTAMALTILTQISGCVGSAFVFDHPLVSIFTLLSVCRFVLGVGCGGVYPLAAIMASQSSAGKSDGGKSVARVFSMQGVGYISVPLLALLLIAFFGDDSDVLWRVLLGFGAVPGLFLMYLRLRWQEGTKGRGGSRKREEGGVSVWQAIKSEPDLARKLLGTAGGWFLFDVRAWPPREPNVKSPPRASEASAKESQRQRRANNLLLGAREERASGSGAPTTSFLVLAKRELAVAARNGLLLGAREDRASGSGAPTSSFLVLAMIELAAAARQRPPSWCSRKERN